MNEITKTLKTYLTTKYNINENEYNLDNVFNKYLNYDFFIPRKELTFGKEEYSILSLIFEFDLLSSNYLFNISYRNDTIYKMIMSFTSEEINELKKYKSVPGFILYLNYIYLGNFGSTNNFTYKYIGDEAVEIKFKDPFYKFEELDLFNFIKTSFNLSANEALSMIEDEFYDYATYSIGEYNDDCRDEFILYTKELKKKILENKFDKSDNEKIKLLKSYLKVLEEVENELYILDFAKNNKDFPKDFLYKITPFRSKINKSLNVVPEKYRKNKKLIIDDIDKFNSI